MEKQQKTEIRKLLTGRTIRDEEGWLIAVPEGSYMIYHGVSDRRGYRKIKEKQQRVKLDTNNEEAFYLVLKGLQDMGILVNMETMPDALCALCRMQLTKAVLLCVTPVEDGVVLVQAFTGRSFTAGISCRIAINKLIKKIAPQKKD
jgi:hypothetical protein